MMGAFRDGIVVERGSGFWPPSLEDLPNPPERLFVRGDPSALTGESLSIVGARRASPYGLAVAELASRIAVESGLAVVSGGALGCDRAAGDQAVARGGVGVVVLGSGADVVYPRSSAGLVERTLSKGGAVVSLERWGSPPRRYAFPKRNRVIAALSRAVFVAEAGMPSGTFSTAECAAGIGREVLAAPGSIFSRESRGTNYLISVGATCISDENELECALSRIYGVLRHPVGDRGETPGSTDVERAVIRALTASPERIDSIARHVRLTTRQCLEVLGNLTVAGLVERMEDGRYAATPRALHAQTALGGP